MSKSYSNYEEELKIGSYFKRGSSSFYILARVANDRVIFINLYSGNRYSDNSPGREIETHGNKIAIAVDDNYLQRSGFRKASIVEIQEFFTRRVNECPD